MSVKKPNKICWLHIRLTEADKKFLLQQQQKTTCLKLSRYARHILLNKKVTSFYRNQSLDELAAELILLRRELSAIGNNFNQLVKKIHSSTTSQEMIALARTSTTIQEALLSHSAMIETRIYQIADQWLQ